MQPVYFNGTVADPENDYTYDALYRLIQAEGRELAGNNNTPTYNDSSRMGITPIPIASTDTAKMRRYIQYYDYDAVGNFIQMQHTVTGGTGNWSRNYTTDNNSNKLMSTVVGSGTPESYAYDNRGNIVSGFSHLQSMSYNAENRLEQVAITGTRTAYYQYDANGQRVRKTITDTSSNTTEIRKYIGEWEVYSKLAGSSLNIERETLHISDDTGRIALIDTRTQGTGAEPPQLLRYQYSNHLQSAALELDYAGDIISYEEYYPYGSTSFQSGRSLAEVSLKRYRYCAAERDEENGFYYFGARYYAPWLCRWIASDPINSENYNLQKGYGLEKNKERDFLELAASSYEYCYDNPVRFSDLSGEQVPPLTNPASLIWKQAGEEISPIEQKSVEVIKNFQNETNETIDKSFIVALKAVAYKKTPELLLDDVLGVNMNEARKQEYFNNNFEGSVGILLYEFATGTGPQHRDFYYSKNTPNSFANAIVEGYVLKDVVEGIYRRVKEEVINNGIDWNSVKKRSSFYGFSIEFSPDQTGLRIDKSIERHIESNAAQFFLGGATVNAYPIDDTTASIQILNETSRRSLMLHVAKENYNVGPLRTISQTIHFKVEDLNPNKTVNYQPDIIDKGLNKIKWLQNALD